MSGEVRVGRIVGQKYPSYPGFTPIVVMTKSSPYGDLSPYVLKDEHGRIMENIWQFSKTYERVPQSTQRYSRWDPTVIWNWPAEEHVTNNSPNDNYWRWRLAGMYNPYPVRYPVGYEARHKCLCAISDQGETLNYAEARKKIYLPIYVRLVKQQPRFWALKERLQKGENLLIIEVDGPHQESLDYYKTTYGVGDDFIEQETIRVTPERMSIVLNDLKHPFGHGYCLGLALLDL